MLKRTVQIILGMLLLLVLLGQLLDSELDINESIEIAASPGEIYPLVNDLKQWPKWTPWETKDGKIYYGNISQGVGASQTWRDGMGKGRLKITASSVQNGIAYDVYFGDNKTPMISAIEFHALQQGQTRVHWRMHGSIDVPVIGTYLAILVKFRTGLMYQKGLQRLKQLVEAAGAIS